MKINPVSIGQRRINYACCAMSYMDKYINGLKFGDKNCQTNRNLWLYMLWAKSVADRTPFFEDGDWNTDFNNDFNIYGFGQCVSHDFARQVFEKADCYCDQCGCPPEDETIVYPPPPDPCAITPTYVVIGAVDVDQRLIIEAGGPSIGDKYFVVSDSGGFGWTVNTIVTWNGTGWDSFTPANGEVVDAGGTFWVTYDSTTPGLLFPGVTATLVNLPGSLYIIQTDDQQISQYTNRNVRLEMLTPGGWVSIPAYAPFIPEANITNPIPFDPGNLEFSAVRAVYIDGDCSYEGPFATIVPPIGSCGTLVATATTTATCDRWFVILSISDAVGYPLGNIEATVNGVPQTPIPANINTFLLGPYFDTPTPDEVEVTVTNSFDSECNVAFGPFTNPAVPVPSYTVLSAEDASFEPFALPGQSYYIVSNNVPSVSPWGSNVGNIWNGAIFITPVAGTIIEESSVSDYSRFWEAASPQPIQLYPSITLDNTFAYPDPWTLVSSNPYSASLRDRIVIVDALYGSTWQTIWLGEELDLATPQTLSLPDGTPDNVRITYYGGFCPVTIEGTITVAGSLDVTCGAQEYFTYQYNNLDNLGIVISADSGDVTLQFIAGTMGIGTVIRGYEGTDNSGTPILSLTGNFANLAGVSSTVFGNSIYLEIDAAGSGAEGQDPWVFSVSCATGSVQPTAIISSADDCDNWEFSILCELIDAGDNPSGEAEFQYSVNGGTPIVVGPYAPLVPFVLGPFAYNDVVEITVLHETDPLANNFYGAFTSSGSCPAFKDPCAPDATQSVQYAVDLADLPVGSPGDAAYIISDNTNIGTFPVGSVLSWSGSWSLLFPAPFGLIVYGANTNSFFYQSSIGPVDYAAPIDLQVNTTALGPADAWKIRITTVQSGAITTNRSVALEVLNNNVWTQVWIGNEQDLDNWNYIGISIPFQQYRTVYNYDSCPFEV